MYNLTYTERGLAKGEVTFEHQVEFEGTEQDYLNTCELWRQLACQDGKHYKMTETLARDYSDREVVLRFIPQGKDVTFERVMVLAY